MRKYIRVFFSFSFHLFFSASPYQCFAITIPIHYIISMQLFLFLSLCIKRAMNGKVVRQKVSRLFARSTFRIWNDNLKCWQISSHFINTQKYFWENESSFFIPSIRSRVCECVCVCRLFHGVVILYLFCTC